MCRTADITPGRAGGRVAAQEEARLEIEIKAAHARTRQSYGPERLQKELKDHGITVGVSRIKRIRKKLGYGADREEVQGDDGLEHNMPVAENLLGQNFQVTAPNRVWVSDITYIPTDEGWLYLAGHKDLFSKNCRLCAW